MKSNSFYLSEFNNLTNEFPSFKDLDGAMKGIVRLQSAYELNLTAISERGRVEYTDQYGQYVGFDCYERFHLLDLAAFSSKATEQKKFSISVGFLKEAFRLLPKATGTFAISQPIVKELKIMRSNVVKLNNGYLIKREKLAGNIVAG